MSKFLSFKLILVVAFQLSFTCVYAQNSNVPITSILGLLLDDNVIVSPIEGCNDTNDSDNDRLLNCYETNTGNFVNAKDTGTNPNVADTDGDGIRDGDEVLGTVSGLNLPAMGVNPLKKNILLEYDWFDDSLDCAAHTHRPTLAQINRFTSAFTNAPVSNPDGTTGITVINDYGQGGVFNKGNLINDSNGVLVGGVDGSEFKNYKAIHFDANRNGYFHYVILPHNYNTSSGSSGQAEILGDDMIVSLQCFIFNDYGVRNVANTIMHELGHNLNLRHGGNTNCNHKPNYNSVMSYRYQFPGVDTNCNVTPNGVLDFSNGSNITLDERNLNENNGVCGPSNPIDWNNNGSIESLITLDINSNDDFQVNQCGGTLTTYSDFNDWANIVFSGISDADGATLFSPIEIMSCSNSPDSHHEHKPHFRFK